MVSLFKSKKKDQENAQKEEEKKVPDKLMKTLVAWLEAQSWKYTTMPDAAAIKCGVEGLNTSYRLLFKCNEAAEQFVVYFSVDQKTIISQRTRVCLYLTRANYGLNIGNFEMDFEDGEIRYKISIDVEDGELSLKMISNFVGIGLRTFDRYYPGIMAVMFASCDPKLEVDKAEGRLGEAQPVVLPANLPTSPTNSINTCNDDANSGGLPRAVRASSITARHLPEATVFVPSSTAPPTADCIVTPQCPPSQDVPPVSDNSNHPSEESSQQ